MKRSRICMAAATALMVAACGSGGGNAGNEAQVNAGAPNALAPGGDSVAAAIGADGDLGRLGELVRNAGFDGLFGGTGPYTLFAPDDGAFDRLGEARFNELKSEAMRPQAIALLRAHVVPGIVSRRDLEAAIERAGQEPVQMRTMAGDTLRFSRDGDSIVVAAADGSRARLVEETLAANGAVQRIDAVLIAPPAPAN